MEIPTEAAEADAKLAAEALKAESTFKQDEVKILAWAKAHKKATAGALIGLGVLIAAFVNLS